MKRSTFEEIVNNPSSIPIPRDAAQRYFVAKELIKKANADNLDAIVTFILRKEFSPEYSILVIAEACCRDIHLCNTPAFVRWAKENKSLQLF